MLNFRKLILLIIANAMLACSTPQALTPYDSQITPPPKDNLLTPPGLSMPKVENSYKTFISESINNYQINNIKDINLMQAGSEHWLLINNKKIDQVWQMVIAYLTQQGLSIEYQNQALGIIQTTWANKNEVLIQNGIRGFFTWLGWGSMYTLPSQFMFRITLLQNTNNVQIFVNNYQMNEVFLGCNQLNTGTRSALTTSERQSTIWISATYDTQIDLDFLLQLMAFGGLNSDEIKIKLNSANEIIPQAEINNNTIIIKHDLTMSWNKTLIALGKINFGIAAHNQLHHQLKIYSLTPMLKQINYGFSQSTNKNHTPKAQYLLSLSSKSNTETVLNITQLEQTNNISTKDFLTKLLLELK